MTKHEKETYEKPEIRTEEIELSAYGRYGQRPVVQHPIFGGCCNGHWGDKG